MAEEHANTFTQTECEAIHDRIATLEDMRLLGGETVSIDETGGQVIFVMPLEDAPPRYAIRKREGRFYLLNGDASMVVAAGPLDKILEALP